MSLKVVAAAYVHPYRWNHRLAVNLKSDLGARTLNKLLTMIDGLLLWHFESDQFSDF
jgi:hypothetical protein